jgi:hypothetical protein
MLPSIGPAELIVIMSLCCLPLLAGGALVGLAVWAARRPKAAYRACPYCAETIRAEAVVCRFCGRDVAPSPAGAAQDEITTQ